MKFYIFNKDTIIFANSWQCYIFDGRIPQTQYHEYVALAYSVDLHEEYCFHWSNTVGLMRAMEKTRHAHIAHMKFQLVGTHSSTERTEDSVSRMISELICQITINHHISTVDPSSLTSTFPAEKPCRTNQTSRTLMAPLLLHLLKQMQSYFKKHVYYSTGSL